MTILQIAAALFLVANLAAMAFLIAKRPLVLKVAAVVQRDRGYRLGMDTTSIVASSIAILVAIWAWAPVGVALALLTIYSYAWLGRLNAEAKELLASEGAGI